MKDLKQRKYQISKQARDFNTEKFKLYSFWFSELFLLENYIDIKKKKKKIVLAISPL